MIEITNNNVIENGYDIADEAKAASIFGIGNGYFGLRGSLEEFGDVFVQGLYIRGVFDTIVEIPQTFCDNTYMKNYYFDGQKLKQFEREDSCINICDPVQIRVYINGKHFLPWTGEVKKWTRYIDMKTGGLIRDVIWDDGEGHLTEFIFERYCSFDNNHLIFQKAEIRKINHDLPIEIKCGIDTLVKTNGQHRSVVKEANNNEDEINIRFYMGEKYNHEVYLSSHNEYENLQFNKINEEEGFYYSSYLMDGNKAEIRKVISMYSNVDPVNNFIEKCKQDSTISYNQAYQNHIKKYEEDFNMIDIKIHNNDELDSLLRYTNYQTLIGFDRYDSVHSLSAKNLTAEKYNQFVWWDAEIFNLPIVISTFPNAAKHCLEYRYRCLDEARKIAKQDGYRGAKFAFCSSVKGDENVWIYARHPFLQIHISGDVAYGIYNYYMQTGDKQFMNEKGLIMMLEVIRYFSSRSTLKDDGYYHLLNVTGTDEHHDYIDDDAYTNIQVQFIAKQFKAIAEQLNYPLSKDDENDLDILINKLFIQTPNEDGIIPQFTGYLSLNPELELVGNGSAKGFQMKNSGLYHKSQIIKQPDVLNLYTYLNLDIDPDIYKKNFDYYYAKCESSSSLSYPVHALSALQNGYYDIFMENLYHSLTVDIKDIFHGAYQGVHAGCIAGGWYNIYRGIFGIKSLDDAIYLNPIFDSPINDVEMNFIYHNEKIHINMKNGKISLYKDSDTPLKIIYKGIEKQFINCLTINN